MSDDDKVSQRYRELPGEEPPRHLDEAILAAARRAAESRPAPLVAPTGRRRWTFPLAAAAVVVLSISVAVHVEREQPDEEALVASRVEKKSVEQPRPAEAPKAGAKQAPQRPTFTPDPQRERATRGELRRERDTPARQDSSGAAAQAPAAAPPVAAAQERAEAERQQARVKAATGSADRAAGNTATLAKLAEQSPEQMLQGIADLRRQGRDEEADKALAEFRKRYPDYKISEAILEKVERRSR